jgi:hypothetical protein
MKGKQINAPSFDVRADLHGVIGAGGRKFMASGPHRH